MKHGRGKFYNRNGNIESRGQWKIESFNINKWFASSTKCLHQNYFHKYKLHIFNLGNVPIS